MAKFYTLGCYTAKGLAGFVNNPSTDRKAATSALAASVGAKVTQYSGLRGKYDFMAVMKELLIKLLQLLWLPFLVVLSQILQF